MLSNQFILPIHSESVVDLFAGGGGASTGIEMAIGRHVDIAINHDPEALSLHAANHPQTRHYCEDVFDVDPRAVTADKPVGLLWASPDCKHFSKAKGSKPVSKKIRSLAWVVVKWAKLVRPRIICLENVEEFQTWGPLGADNMPIKVRTGETFQKWIQSIEKLGYIVEWRTLRACDYGAPTIRKRLFLVARRDGQPIVWPEPTHGRGLKPYRTAAENIDFTLPCPSIFGRKKSLSENTLRRIAKGIKKFVLDNPEPFIVQVNHSGDGFRGQSTDKPMSTLTAKNGMGIVSPTIVSIANYSGESVRDGAAPLSTVTANPKGGHHALVCPYFSRRYTWDKAGASAIDGRPSMMVVWGKDERCTDFKDKNGKLIYENDILYNKHIGGNIDRGVVKWGFKMLQWDVVHWENKEERVSLCLAVFAVRDSGKYDKTENHCEIIGNIHENIITIDGQIQLKGI